MQDINLVVVTGGLTKNAVVREAQNGHFYVFSIGFKKREKDKTGNWVSKSLYRDCSFYSKADFYLDALKKGTKVCVKGEMDTDEYTDVTGQQRKKDYIRVTDVQIFPKTEAKPQTQQKTTWQEDNTWTDNFQFPDEAPTF